MAEVRDLLVEIGTEELPPKALQSLSAAFADALTAQLGEAGLAFAQLRRFATPRRLAVWIRGLPPAQPDRELERKGPALKAAYDADGNPTKAAQGFARSCGVEVGDLEVRETPKGAWLVYRQRQEGKPTKVLVPAMVEEALARLPIPKRMRWGAGDAEFVRPVHWILMLFGDEVIEGNILGIPADRLTRGHRFHHPAPIEIERPDQYADRLLDPGHVVAVFEERRATIRQQVEAKAAEAGGVAHIDEVLLDEVCALNEWPVAVLGRYEARFLEIPPEVLITTMQSHQKYFPVMDESGGLKPFFITIANIDSREPGQVQAGNERVIRPRFSDAAFFWEQDLKSPLETFVEGLKGVVFQNRLGTLYDKTRRIGALTRLIADRLGHDEGPSVRAAELSKCDLMSEMVGEFPSLQGIMGRYYAEHAGELAEVATAIEEHYLPRHAGDDLPQTAAGQAVAIADKLDTLVGIFAIGQRPSGVKDPFGLRRAALGVLRILIEVPLDLDLLELLEHAAGHIAPKVEVEDRTIDEVFDYMMERLRAYYADRSMTPDVVEAVMARRPTRPADFDQRVRAVAMFRTLPEAGSLASANKRIRNILRKAEDDYPSRPDPRLLRESGERALASELERVTPEVEPLLERGEYTEALRRLASLKKPVDQFFDEVMVMTDENDLRRNRLALLASLSSLFLRIADLSRLQQANP